jgi:hypothetical protein
MQIRIGYVFSNSPDPDLRHDFRLDQGSCNNECRSE